MVAGLKTFRCRVRASGCTTTLQCLAPTAQAAAYVIARNAMQSDGAPWIQIVVSEWSGVLGEFIAPPNAIIISAGEAPPIGVESVVFIANLKSERLPR